jgi:hypothetical protein
MSKAKITQSSKNKPVKQVPPVLEREPLPLEKKNLLFPLPGFWIQAIIVAVLGIAIYWNSTRNEYALDDGIVILQNEFVQEGTQGIGKIMSKDAYYSFYSQMGGEQELSGGRYRPLSIATFAIEQQMFGKDTDPKTEYVKEEEARLTFIRHAVNVLLYALSGVVLLLFLQRFVFRHDPDIAFLATLIFIVHPLHTEAVANVKSRDEIMSFLLIISTLIAVLRYSETRKLLHFFAGVVLFFLSLLAKEYAFTLLALIPILLYVHRKYSVGRAVTAVLPYLGVFVIYMMIRIGAVGLNMSKHNPEILNNPYLYATATEKLATKIFMPWNYIRLLFYPRVLSSDYSYNNYPYLGFGSPMVWVSLIVHIGLLVLAVRLTLKRHILGFALFFYLLNMLLVSNFLMEIGATMGERLIYHSSLGFAIAVSYLAVRGVERRKASLNTQRIVIGALTLTGIVLCSYKVIQRNPAWENDYTLFTTDVNTVPNSVLVNGNAGAQYINSADWPENKQDTLGVERGHPTRTQQKLMRQGITYLKRAVAIHKPPVRLRNAPKTEINAEYVNGYLNLGLGSYRLYEFDNAEAYWDTARAYFPSNPYLKTYYKLLSTVYINQAFGFGKDKKFDKAIEYMERAAAIDEKNPDVDDPEIWYNLGGAYYSVQKFDKAREAWSKCLTLKPDHAEAQRGMSALPPVQQ